HTRLQGDWSSDVCSSDLLRYREGLSKQWRLDLAWTKDLRGKPRPAIVVIHGGGWLEGDKSSFASRKDGVPGNIIDFAELGFVARSEERRVGKEGRSGWGL